MGVQVTLFPDDLCTTRFHWVGLFLTCCRIQRRRRHKFWECVLFFAKIIYLECAKVCVCLENMSAAEGRQMEINFLYIVMCRTVHC